MIDTERNYVGVWELSERNTKDGANWRPGIVGNQISKGRKQADESKMGLMMNIVGTKPGNSLM